MKAKRTNGLNNSMTEVPVVCELPRFDGGTGILKTKRKRWLWGLAILMVVFVALCALPIMETHISGIENYSPADSTLSLSLYLFPDDDFPLRFDYLEADYQYYFNGVLMDGYATAFSVLKYTPEVYEQAKEYCITELSNTDEHQFQVGEFVFIEHLCYIGDDGMGNYVVKCQFPRNFNMFAYNDADHTLLFIGFYGDPKAETTQLAQTDFAAFYEEHFGKYYSLIDR